MCWMRFVWLFNPRSGLENSDYEAQDLEGASPGQEMTLSHSPRWVHPSTNSATFSAVGASAYLFGNFGTAAKQLHSFKLTQ
jgi:hypothetical protein